MAIRFIHVGTTNEVKVAAVRETYALYPRLRDALVIANKVQSGVSEQPMSMEETIRGSINRANAAIGKSLHNDETIGIGIESGLMEVPYSRTGYMDFCSVAITDVYGTLGMRVFLGLSPAFECPQRVIDLIKINSYTLNDAFLEAGLTKDPVLGCNEGAIGLLTGGLITRKDYTKYALITAIASWENR